MDTWKCLKMNKSFIALLTAIWMCWTHTCLTVPSGHMVFIINLVTNSSDHTKTNTPTKITSLFPSRASMLSFYFQCKSLNAGYFPHTSIFGIQSYQYGSDAKKCQLNFTLYQENRAKFLKIWTVKTGSDVFSDIFYQADKIYFLQLSKGKNNNKINSCLKVGGRNLFNSKELILHKSNFFFTLRIFQMCPYEDSQELVFPLLYLTNGADRTAEAKFTRFSCNCYKFKLDSIIHCELPQRKHWLYNGLKC